MAVLQFHPKLSIRQCFHYLTNHFDDFLLTRHKLQLSIIQHAAQFDKGYFHKFMCYIYYLTTFLRIDFLSFFILFLQVCKLLFINYNIVNFNLFFKILFNKNIVEQEAIPNLKKYYPQKVEKMSSLVVGIGAGARYKMLKPGLLCEILKLFLNKKNIKKIIFLGAGDRDQKYLGELKKYINFSNFNIENLVNKISLEESIDIISKCQYYLGFESGLFHIAASLRIKTYGIFTKINEFSHNNWENVTIFYGNPCISNKNEYFGNSELNNISLDEVEKLL